MDSQENKPALGGKHVPAPHTENIGLLLSLASAKGVSSANSALAPISLNARSFSVLEVVKHHPGQSQRSIAEALNLDPSQIVSLVDGLQKLELVVRRPASHDRRRHAVVLTAAGEKTYRYAARLIGDSVDEVLTGLDADERQTLDHLLRRIVHPTQSEPLGADHNRYPTRVTADK